MAREDGRRLVSGNQGGCLDSRPLGGLVVLLILEYHKVHGFRIHQEKAGGPPKPGVHFCVQVSGTGTDGNFHGSTPLV